MESPLSKSAGKQIKRSGNGYKQAKIVRKKFFQLFGTVRPRVQVSPLGPRSPLEHVLQRAFLLFK